MQPQAVSARRLWSHGRPDRRGIFQPAAGQDLVSVGRRVPSGWQKAGLLERRSESSGCSDKMQ